MRGDWDDAVGEYEKALSVDPSNMHYRIGLQRAKLESSRDHFAKGKALRTAGRSDMAAIEFEIVVKLDPTNQYAADELQKALQAVQEALNAADERSIDQVKKRAKRINKSQPHELNPSSNEPISLSFPHETAVRDIYRALANAFGINVLFDPGVKDERLAIELKEVTAQTALERLMQAAGHFYKVLDEKTIIIIPDNQQTRRDYEDQVIRTFYLSNGDVDQVTNLVRSILEARNVFPIKALNAITIRDTADKVRIAEKIIEANDKAKAEVVVDVELLQLDMTKARDIGMNLFSPSDKGPGPYNPSLSVIGGGDHQVGEAGKALGSLTLTQLRDLTKGNFSFTIPSIAYGFVKSNSDSQLLAKPELRISEGEKASLVIGQKVPFPVTTFTTTTAGTNGSSIASPVTQYQREDVGIKITLEPRVHHNREVTLKLTVEVSNLGEMIGGSPIVGTRTIESTIRLKDGETNFLAGLIRKDDSDSTTTTPILGDLPILGRVFKRDNKEHHNTDLVLTMTPHIIRTPDITEDDLAWLWVGTQNNLSFRGLSPRIESMAQEDPFNSPYATNEDDENVEPEPEQPAEKQPAPVVEK